MTDQDYLRRTVDMAEESIQRGGGPFACLIVKDDAVVGQGVNQVTLNHDPTAHAEIVAIRVACQTLKDFQLKGCVVYASCEPCPMCLGALYWARPDRVVYAADRLMAAHAGFDDGLIYEEIVLPDEGRSLDIRRISIAEADAPFAAWAAHSDRIRY